MINKELLKDGLDQIGISYSDEMLSQTEKFYDMLIEKNKVMNLTAITDPDEFIQKHILDSLIIFRVSSFSKLSRENIIDVGTGAGFPGIPLKIFFPDTNLLLLDSLNKRLNFINEVIAELKLTDISTIHGRAEDIAHDKKYREKFDLCVSRAVANLSSLSELCIPFVKRNGYFISYKSSGSEDEIKAAAHAVKILCDGSIVTENVGLPETDILRTFVIVKKERNTPSVYPRKAGTPLKSPL